MIFSWHFCNFFILPSQSLIRLEQCPFSAAGRPAKEKVSSWNFFGKPFRNSFVKNFDQLFSFLPQGATQ